MKVQVLTFKGVVELQVENLLALAELLLNLPVGYEHFDMWSYSSSHFSPTEVKEYNSCGTSGCAIGHAPLLNLPINSVENLNSLRFKQFGFTLYSNNFTFGDQYTQTIADEEDNAQHTAAADGTYKYHHATDYVWDYLYAQYWNKLDNTPQGAGKRILFLLANPDAIETAMDELDEPVSEEMYKMYSEAELTVEDVKRKLNYV